MARVLIADDDAHIREVVRFALERAGHQVIEAADGNAALKAFSEGEVELIVLDIVMPEHDGLEVCRKVRESSRIPILFLSSRDEELDRILGLEMGADDYVTKPFSPRELVARVKAMLRRSIGTMPESSDGTAALRRGALTVDPERHKCLWGDEELFLTATEFMLLRTLMTGHERVYSRSELVERSYAHGHHITERTVDSHIRRIRKKFSGLDVDPVETVYGVGYRLNVKGPTA